MADVTLNPSSAAEIDLRPGPPPDLGNLSGLSSDAGAMVGTIDSQPVLWLREPNFPDETSRLALPPSIRSAVSPMVTALRWGAVLYGMPSAITNSSNGDLWIVATLSIVLFLTVWRTFRPLKLAWDGPTDRWMPVVDGVILGIGVGLSGAFGSPFIFCVFAAVIVAAFGWGLFSGATVLVGSVIAMFISSFFSSNDVTDTELAANGLNLGNGRAVVLASMIVAGGLVVFARTRLLDAEQRRMSLTSRLKTLSETNDLLGILNQVARTLPISLDMREALHETRGQLTDTFNASTIGLLTRDEQTAGWVPQLADGCSFPQTVRSSDLIAPMAQALLAPGAIVVHDPSGEASLNQHSRSGLYTALRTRGKVIGLLGIESTSTDGFTDREKHLAEGLAEALALTLDNARSFGRLRTLGADQERTRIARDLHDRLGQWLTYISLELERIMSSGDGDAESLESLYGDVQTAIDELRETLRQLRAGITPDKPLAVVGEEITTRFGERTGIATEFKSRGLESLDVRVETELLRILQEALNNIEKHAKASEVQVAWTVANGIGVLRIEDDGRGFVVGDATRDSAYGLIGMRERADVVDASLDIRSAPDRGTTITVRAQREGVQL